MMPEINLILGKIAGFNLCAGIGLLSMVCLSMWQARRLKLDGHTTQLALESIPIVTILAIIPACLSDIAFRWENFRENLLGFGMTFYGWLLGCVVGWRSYESIAHLRPQFLLNFFSPSLALAQAFGRIGCFLAGCCHGKPALPCMGVRFPEHSIPWERYGDIPLYPVQLMESAWLFSITLLLVLKVPFRLRFATYLVLMGSGRFFMEFLRGDARGAVFGVVALSPARFISAFIVVAGIAALFKRAGEAPLSATPGNLEGGGFNKKSGTVLMRDITKTHFRWRKRIGLPFPAIFGHTTIEIEKFDGRCLERKTYGFVGWGDSWLENIFLFFRIVSGFSVDGNWHDNAENLLGIAQPWRNISEEEYLALKRKLDLLMSFAVKYNLYTRNSWQVPKRLLKTWMNGG